ncbi:hypothetical protein NLG97_g6380 [Lecanicillium saksenae]|uniref:Uncharacterized protein n=1 Tax=Lecanicillium saksenae TaxID=468837 RepID=A0ACC1QPT0_9HYPO|nr:hypothetical protein NLG97_g6380 [Lecanicillium saksenae]
MCVRQSQADTTVAGWSMKLGETAMRHFKIGPNSWKIRKEILFQGFLKSLSSLDTISRHSALDTIEFRSLVRLQKVEGHACATVVHLSGSPDVKFVFKGVDFHTFLSGYELGCFEREVDLFTHAIALLSGVSGHPNISPLPGAQVVFTDLASNDKSICGVLHPFYEKGNLADEIQRSNANAEGIPAALKRKWCFQMALALAHTHFVGGTFHMDISPANFVIDDNDNLLLTTWEQGDASVVTAAPEIDGTWDAANSATK